MFFSSPPKINRIANYLQAQLAEFSQDRWAHFLVEAKKYHSEFAILQEQSGVENIQEIVNTSSWLQAKENFSWRLDLDTSGTIVPAFAVDNAKKQYHHYTNLLHKAERIVAELNEKSPNYQTIITLAKEIKASLTIVPSIISGDPISIEVGYFSGSNLFVNFFSGIGGLIYAPIAFLAGVLFAIPGYFLDSQYFGTASFLLDTAIYFCESLFNVASSVLFPIGMLYSKYHTDSYNIVKGDLPRCIDNLIALATNELPKDVELKEINTSSLSIIN
ncbi:hypothetical protein [Legionella cardiaca]|uniref:Uncharacterized protein n=1 Tax=Legionella cardiaca TaxID=1071983 RepID=A0ABY8ATW9_9GAMM|nr:hypothetical protein [Legionella cardiaca]WED43933.1 hypothetical protein PXX05_03885 [Legionella cardiaca]